MAKERGYALAAHLFRGPTFFKENERDRGIRNDSDGYAVRESISQYECHRFVCDKCSHSNN